MATDKHQESNSPSMIPEIPSISQTVDIDEYFRQTKFDGAREIGKESNLDDFFKQKYIRVNNYLQTVEHKSKMAATQARSSVRNYGVRLRLAKNLLAKFQGRELAKHNRRASS